MRGATRIHLVVLVFAKVDDQEGCRIKLVDDQGRCRTKSADEQGGCRTKLAIISWYNKDFKMCYFIRLVDVKSALLLLVY